LSVINTASNEVTATIPIGENANAVAFSPNGAYAYVTDSGSGSLSVINTATNMVTTTIPVGNNPGGLSHTFCLLDQKSMWRRADDLLKASLMVWLCRSTARTPM
jgi:YVTN family beta-propeller protein